MSLRSLARQGKQLRTFTKPKPRKAVEPVKPFNVTAFAKEAHESASTSPSVKTRGAFSGCTVAERNRKKLLKARK